MNQKHTAVSAPPRHSLGEGGFLKLRVLLGFVVLFGAVLVALFAADRPQVPIHERATAPNRFSLVPSGTVQKAWVVRYDGAQHSADSANDLAIDASGNVYVTGGSSVSGGPPDYVTIKYNSAGEQQWLADFSGENNTANFANAIALDASGNVFVTGRSIGSDASYDCATVKYNPSGQEAWVARYNGPGNGYDEGRAIAVDGSGNVYVTGPSAGSGGDFDYATIKYDSSGSVQWIARYNGPGNATDFAYALV